MAAVELRHSIVARLALDLNRRVLVPLNETCMHSILRITKIKRDELQ